MESPIRPVTCKLLPVEFQKRKATVIRDLKSQVIERKELEDGHVYMFESKDEILDKLNDFIKTERLCCDFFTFQIMIERGRLLLTITGPDDSKEFLRREIDL